MGNYELYRRYRPTKFDEIIGQHAAVKSLREFLSNDTVPHAILFTGPSGTGKTSLARIMRDKMGCGATDFYEINAADYRGIDMVRDIRSKVNLAPMSGKVRVWLIDEAAQLTPQAQDSFLKLLEDPPDHVYFMLATTDPQKLKKTIKTRCTEIKVKLLNDDQIELVIARVCESEKVTLDKDVLEKIIEIAEGSARKALVFLHQIIDIEDEQLEVLSKVDSKQQAIDLCRTMMKPNVSWKSITKILKNIEDEPETVRRIMLGYMTSVALNGKTDVIPIIDSFLDNYYDSGKAGLVMSCWEAIQ